LADESESGDFLHDAVESRLVKNDGVLRLVLDLSLRPLLLFRGLSTAGRWGSCLSFSLKTKKT